ncbi:hypothetical protein DTO166G4_6814 [Paecilomyces variotii]|nr:hypothetical protein DTO166G4_6814 [Paecilomyces variotii]KAJ9232974.1 hypothetical protein DTO166G5_5986 [Paecilomyces variotii]KAJ9304784.1 hypothetical protein DTO217A2_5750 [Paecilomyces variotii]KAJ9371203.1 hypothetical protein DTO282E5_4058 [Paecilomyces variotii]
MDHGQAETLPCPFCSFTDSDAYFLAQHVELCHPENGHSPFIADQEGSSEVLDGEAGAGEYIDCPRGCGEVVSAADLPSHLNLHVAEDIAFEDEEAEVRQLEETPGEYQDDFDRAIEHFDGGSSLRLHKGLSKDRHRQGPSGKQGYHENTSLSTVHGGNAKRLGRAELGPHAHEKQMPSWLRKMLENGANIIRINRIGSNGMLERHEAIENETAGVVPVLIQLCQQDQSVQRAFFCSEKVRHVFKMRMEGGFCGYRNIQMLISHVQDAKRPGHEHFPGRLPTILRLQDLIEQAWDMGFNSSGRVETGGIRGTRKYIGTPEAQALFQSLGIKCEANAFHETKQLRAYDALLINVAEYFRQGVSLEGNDKVLKTDLPPIYLQHPGHSLTIIGFEVREDGTANLLVFDPMFRTSPAIQRLIGTSVRPSANPARLMRAYRRGTSYLRKFKAFETLKLSPIDESVNK